jgi:type II secretory pathway component PulF
MTIGQARQAIADALARAELYRMWHAGQRMGATHGHILDAVGPLHGSAAAEQLRLALLEGSGRRDTIATTITRSGIGQPIEKALLSAGEEMGGLEQSLQTLALHYKAEHRLLLKVWSQLTYPLVSSFLMFFIAPLPLLTAGNTKAYLLSAGSGAVLWYLFGGALIVGLAKRYANRTNYVLARLARGLAAGIEAGLPLDRTALLAAECSGHPAILAYVRRQSPRTLATQPLTTTYASCPLVPVEMKAALNVAELSGDFSNALRKLAELYDDPK